MIRGDPDAERSLPRIKRQRTEMDGQEAVRQLRALEEARGIRSTYGVKIIMTTAVDDMKEVMRSFYELCDAYLVKPVDTSALLARLKEFRLVD